MNNSLPTDFILDFETFGLAPKGAVIDLAIVPFVNDPHNVPTFEQLVARGKRIKFSAASQRQSFPRVFDADTLAWWKNQSEEARSQIRPSEWDLELDEGIKNAEVFINTFATKQSQGWCRGTSFDFTIYIDILRQVYNTNRVEEKEPCFFWKQRDVRTAIENILMVRDMTETPLPLGVLDGYVAHNSVHDCAKDILMLLYAKRYALGLEECPQGDYIDPNSIKKQRA